MGSEEVKKKIAFIEEHLKESTKEFIGQKVNPERIKEAILTSLTDLVESNIKFELEPNKSGTAFTVVPKNEFTRSLINGEFRHQIIMDKYRDPEVK